MKWFFFFLGCLFAFQSAAQRTFIKRVGFSCEPTVCGSIEVTDSCYYVAGWARDSAFGCQISLLWAKIDPQGNVLNHTLHSEPATISAGWTPTLHTDSDGNLIVGADLIDTIHGKALLVKWDSDGSVLWKKKHVNLDVDFLFNSKIISVS